MSEATFTRNSDKAQVLASATISGRQVYQLPSGELAFLDDDDAISSGSYTDEMRSGAKATVNKTTGVVLLAGQEAFWDDSANQITYRQVNDRDRSAGVVVEDAASAALAALIDLNKRPAAHRCLITKPTITSPTGTHATGNTGFGFPLSGGGSFRLLLSSTNEAQKVERIGVDGIDATAKWIWEGEIRVESVGVGTAPDFSIGMASESHATDMSSATTLALFHMDGNDTSLWAETDDNTTDTAPVDTTVDVTAGTSVSVRRHLMIDGRDKTSVKFYIDGVRVNSGTTYNMAAIAGTIYPIAHLEKTAAADVFIVHVDKSRVWIAE